jgi:carboxypeptidase Taq
MSKKIFYLLSGAFCVQSALFSITPTNTSPSMQQTYQEFTDYSKQISLISSIEALASWDQETFMPQGAIEGKSKQLEFLSNMVHKESTSEKYKHLLQSLIDLETGKVLLPFATDEDKANLREWRRDFIHENKLPDSFVQMFTQATCHGLESWKKAKAKKDFSLFQPDLEKIVALCRKKAEYLGYKKHPYDALLDLFEPNLTVEELDGLFSRLKIELIALLKEIKEKPSLDNSFIFKKYAKTSQMAIANKLMDIMNLDRNYTALNESVHPFTSGIYSPIDVRITTKILEKNLSSNIFSVIHEGGHALYELGLLEKYSGTPLGQAASMAFHESQSRLWETIIGHSHMFWEYFYPILQKTFPRQLKNISLESFYQGINKVQPGFIRIESDEVSYCLHIIIRYEIEKALLDGTLQVADIPKVWKEKMQAYFGITPPTDDLGCLQDIHWAHGSFGYFPSYALGNMYAAQIFATYQKEHPDWQKQITSGDLLKLRIWLKDKIHSKGRFYEPNDLIQVITKQPLTEVFYVNYLKNKYRALYKLD